MGPGGSSEQLGRIPRAMRGWLGALLESAAHGAHLHWPPCFARAPASPPSHQVPARCVRGWTEAALDQPLPPVSPGLWQLREGASFVCFQYVSVRWLYFTPSLSLISKGVLKVRL